MIKVRKIRQAKVMPILIMEILKKSLIRKNRKNIP
jgi:hypothetical protein